MERPVFEIYRKTPKAADFAAWLRLRFPTAKVSIVNHCSVWYIPNVPNCGDIDGQTLHEQFINKHPAVLPTA